MSDDVRFKGSTPTDGPPTFDPKAVSRIASRIELESVVLESLRLGDAEVLAEEDGWGIGAEWEFVENETGRLHVTFGLTVTSPSWDQYLFAELALHYTLNDWTGLTEEDFSQFVHWNAIFNAWPYWRELVTNITSRTSFGPIIAPVFRMPAVATTDE